MLEQERKMTEHLSSSAATVSAVGSPGRMSFCSSFRTAIATRVRYPLQGISRFALHAGSPGVRGAALHGYRFTEVLAEL